MALPTFVTHYMVRRPKSAEVARAEHAEPRTEFQGRLHRKTRGVAALHEDVTRFTPSTSLRRAG